MKRIICAAALSLTVMPVLAADVGVSVTVDKPGFYGSIDIGDFPRPRTINVAPVIVQPVVGVVTPVYMHVPPGHAKKWSRYCHQYSACGRPVYFVQQDWYEGTYLPKRQGKHGHPGNGGHGNGKGNGNGKGKGHKD